MPSLHRGAAVAALLTLAAASPTKVSSVEKRNPQLSLPPLIPSIPGVTEPLVSLVPPLPVLQVPTPPLESEPFETVDVRPKKIGYFWTGAGDNHHKDFLVAASLDDVSSPLLPLSPQIIPVICTFALVSSFGRRIADGRWW